MSYLDIASVIREFGYGEMQTISYFVPQGNWRSLEICKTDEEPYVYDNAMDEADIDWLIQAMEKRGLLVDEDEPSSHQNEVEEVPLENEVEEVPHIIDEDLPPL
ncbi:hypothetical protein JCGZ_19829 [Jatropha curcas]|uniref:Uncharacterized protein n=1 Tax=Jatropha curcas TaxID=180498 RepID=A0A067JUU7_JATCU|nr:hypothetical protein JCGZ_19829 [Jatropha curcas]